MKIEVKKTPRFHGAPDDSCIHYLIVNGYELGTWYGGNDKKYLNPEKWAKKQVNKRVNVLIRNIERLEKELDAKRSELEAITSSGY